MNYLPKETEAALFSMIMERTPASLILSRAQAWERQIDQLRKSLNSSDDPHIVRHLISVAITAAKKAAPWAVWEGVSALEATTLPEVGFPHPEWKEVATYDIPFTGEVGEWVDVVVPATFGDVSLKAGDRVRLFESPTKDMQDSGMRPRYQIARA